MNDAVLIMQSISNSDRFGIDGTESTHIKAQGQANADVAGGDLDKGGDGVTPKDALRIQEFLIQKVKQL
jgi:hypothetical protein